MRSTSDAAASGGDNAPDSEKKIGREKTGAEKAFGAALKVKADDQSTMSSAENLISQMHADDAWSWALAEQTEGPLDKAMDEVKKARTQFVFDIVSLKAPEIRKKYKDEQLLVECANYTSVMPVLIRELDLQTKVLLGMHQQRLRMLISEATVQVPKPPTRGKKSARHS